MTAAPSTSAARTTAAVRELILRGEFTPGARLGEVELSRRLGVSRTPVREALGRLAAEGLVELAPNRGARVVRWSLAELDGVFELRAALEPRLAGLAASRVIDADVETLDHLAHEMCRLGERRCLDAVVDLNRAFHDRIVALAERPAEANALAGAVHAPIVLRNFHTYDDASLRRSLAHHVEIVAAFRVRDPVWAQAVMTAHIRNARTVMLRTAREEP